MSVTRPPATPAEGVDRRNVVASVLKSCSVVEVLGGGRSEYTVGEVAAATGLGKTTAHRLLSTLILAGWVERGPRNGYRLSITMLRLAHAAQRHFSIRDEALPFLRDLAGAFGDTAFLMVPTDSGAVIVEMVEGNSPLKVNTVSVGTVLPFHVGGGATVMAAYVPEIRERVLQRPREQFTERTDTSVQALEARYERIRADGYVLASEDLNNGVAVVSAPVFDRSGDLICTLSLGGASAGFEGERLARVVEAMCRDSAALSTRLGAPAGLLAEVWSSLPHLHPTGAPDLNERQDER